MWNQRWIVGVVGIAVLCLSLTPSSAEEAPSGTQPPQATVRPVDPLAIEVDKAIEVSTRRYLTGNLHTPWQIMHGLLALRQDYQVKQGGEKVNALEWMSKGVAFKGDQWFERTRYGGRAHPYSKAYAFEGHPDQFLAILAMANVPAEHKFVTRGEQTITISDMVKHAQREINSAVEITWTLWALSHYLGADATWTSKSGEAWSIERLVRMQTREPVRTAACGGSHGLFALTYARNVYLKQGSPLRGVWLEADQKIQRYIGEARSNQNSDWTFSTNYFSGRQHSSSFETRLNTSGHTLEFLVLALPKERLREQWLRNGVFALTKDLLNHQQTPAECGSLYHALDALVIYRDRTKPKPVAEIAATENTTTTEKDNSVVAPK
jgi:hypothetical protein